MVRFVGRLIKRHSVQEFAIVANVNARLEIYSDHPSCSNMMHFNSSRVSRNGIKAPWQIEVSVVTAEVQSPFNIEELNILPFGSVRWIVRMTSSPRLTGELRVKYPGSIYTLICRHIQLKITQAIRTQKHSHNETGV